MQTRLTTCLMLALCLSVPAAYGQGYLYNQVSQMPDYMIALQNNPTVVMQAPLDNVMSDPQVLPFAFNFFGESYTEYRISDNGYISFDVHETTSMNVPTSLPSTSAPRPAIFGFWGALGLAEGGAEGSNQVISATHGVAPERVHVVQWTLVSPENTSPSAIRRMTFSIALYENGKFDINYTDGRYLGVFDAGAGAQNGAGDMAAVIASPDFTWPGPGVQPLVYRFSSLDRDYDATVVEFTLPNKMVISEDAIPVNAKVQNAGNETINSLDVTLDITGSGGYTFNETRTFNDLNLVSNETWSLDDYEWTMNTPGEVLSLEVSVSNINGDAQLDEIAENNSMMAQTFGYLDISGTKRVLLEEFTGTWCGHCGVGALIVEQVLDEHPSVSAVAIHGGSATDPMIIPQGTALTQRYSPAFPMALVDRQQFVGEERIPLSRGAWLGAVAMSINNYTPLNVFVEGTYDADTRETKFSATATFVDYHEPADMRMHIYILEDNVSDANNPAYSQVNYYNNEQGHPHYQAGNPIVGFVHNHVLRAVPTGSGGILLEPENGYQPESGFTQDYSFTLPDQWKAQDIQLVAFVTYEEGSLGDRVVFSSAKANLSGETVSSVNDLRGAETVGLLSPNPSSQLSLVDVHLEQTQRVQLDLYAVNGTHMHTVASKNAYAGDHSFAVDTSDLASGTYKLRLLVGDQIVWRDVVVAR